MLKMSSQDNHEDMGIPIKIEDSSIQVTFTNDTIPKSTQIVSQTNKKQKNKNISSCNVSQGLVTAVPSSLSANNSEISNNTSIEKKLRKKRNRALRRQQRELQASLTTTQVTLNNVQVAMNSMTNPAQIQQHPTIAPIDVNYMQLSVTSTTHNWQESTQSHPICVGILADPPRPLTINDAKNIKNLVRDKILENIRNGGFAPRFAEQPQILNGVLKLFCGDVETFNWLCNIIPKLPQVLDGHKLLVSLLSEMPGYVRAGLLLPDCEEELGEVQQILSHCNSWANVKSWFLIKVEQHKKGLFLALSIPERVVPILLEKNRRLSYLLGSVYVKFYGPQGKLYNTLPADKIKAIEQYLDRERKQQVDQNEKSAKHNGTEKTPSYIENDSFNNNSKNEVISISSSEDVRDELTRNSYRERSPIYHRSSHRVVNNVNMGDDPQRSRDRYQRQIDRDEYERRAYENNIYKSNDDRYQSIFDYDSRDRYECNIGHGRYNDRRDRSCDNIYRDERRPSSPDRQRYNYENKQSNPTEGMPHLSTNYQMPSQGEERYERDEQRHDKALWERNRKGNDEGMSSNNRIYRSHDDFVSVSNKLY